MIYRKSYRITQKVIWWRVSKSFRGALSSHDDVGENFGKALRDRVLDSRTHEVS